MPGGGDLCNRLVDYLAVGGCVVNPPPRVRLPVPLVDDVHLVHCRRDLSDLGDVCAQLVADDARREEIARNACRFFDRHLDRRRLAGYYLSQIHIPRQVGSLRVHRFRTGLSTRRPRQLLTGAFALVLLLLLLFVVLPESLGDWPYNTIGRDTRSARNTHVSPHAIQSSLRLGSQRVSERPEL
ncbi:MAG TPA: glycosyltransferase [Gaiellaceae bacterium]|nr:glycosyltransferase [Gaiellaceae bacterium]